MSRDSTCARSLIAALEAEGVELVFGIPGSHNLELYRALAESSIRHIVVRHEQGAGYAADGYARATGRPGIVLTTSGPGVTNVCTAAGTAYADSVPMLLVSPGIPRGMEGTDSGWLHEVKDQHAHMQALVDQSSRVRDAREAVGAIHETFGRWRSQRPRPVHLEVPLDVLEGEGCESEIREALGANPPHPTDEEIAEAARLMNAALRPAILAGGGCRDAGDALTDLAERWDAPVVTTVNGKGTLSELHQLSLGASLRLAAARSALEQADVLLVVGSEVADSDLWGAEFSPSGNIIRIDISSPQLSKNLRPRVGLCGAASDVLRRLEQLVRPSGRTPADVVQEVRRAIDRELSPEADPWKEVNSVLRDALPDDTIVAGDSAQVSYHGTVHLWPMPNARQFLYPTGYATLGYGLPASIGASLGRPGATVIVLVGDGGFMFTSSELLTARQERLSLPIIIMNDYGFGEIRHEMRERAIEPMAVDLETPDFAMLCRACGGRGCLVQDLRDLPDLLADALTFPGPTVMEVRVG